MSDRFASPHWRIFIAAFLGGLLYTALPGDWRWSTRALAAWDVGAVSYMGLAAMMMRNGSPAEMRRRAALYDEPKLSFILLTMLAISASFLAIFFEFSAAKTAATGPFPPVLLGGFTLFVSWVLTHTMFMLHYAHLHYGAGAAANGIQRPEKGDLNYTDFFYFSFLIGCATEAADFVSMNSAMRRFMIVHSAVAYFFNVVIIALTISVISSFV